MALLTAEEITNLYLYGSKTVPTDLASDSIRRDDPVHSIQFGKLPTWIVCSYCNYPIHMYA